MPYTVDTRRDQMFPLLDEHEIARLRRFGEICRYAADERVMKTGEIAPGLLFVLSGIVEVRQGGEFSRIPTGCRQAWGRQFSRRIGAAFRPSGAGRCRGCRAGGRQSSCRRGGCATCWCRRPNSASASCGADPAPRRSAGSRSSRPDHRRAGRKRRRVAAGKFSHPQRPSARDSGFRHSDSCAKTLLERFKIAARTIADRAVPGRPVAAQSRARASWRAASGWCGRSIPTASTTW